jgi:hypothetical protein
MRWLTSVLAVVVIGALLTLVGVQVYHAGLTAGFAQAAAAGAPGAGAVPVPPVGYAYYGPYSWGFHPWGFFPFGILGGVLFFLLAITLFKGLFFLGRGGPRGRHRGEPAFWNDRLRQVHDEWHRSEGSAPAERPQ